MSSSTVKGSVSKKVPRPIGRVMAKKLYAGHPGLEKRSLLYALCSTFNVSVYAPCHTAWLGNLMDLPGKEPIARREISRAQK